MKNNRFIFCPHCGSKNIQTEDNSRKWTCPDCNFVLYNNVAAAVGILLRNDKGEFLLEKRAKEPKKGYFVEPGGFVDPDETAEEAALRECREEIGVEVQNLKYLCSCINTYEYKDVTYKTCDSWFTADLPKNVSFIKEESEVQSLVWKKITDEKELEEAQIAFDSGKNAIRTLLRKENDGTF